MLGFGSEKKINGLTQRLDRMREQRDWARAQHDTSQAISTRIACKFADNYDLAWDDNAYLADQVTHYQNLLTRHARLLRATTRYLAEIWRLRREVGELKAKAGVPDRAIDPAVPTPELMRVTRQRDEAQGRLLLMQDRLDAYQRASEAADWHLAQRAGARVDAVKALAS